MLQTDKRYRNQFRSDFRVRRQPVIQWLDYLKANHSDYRWVDISLARIEALPVDADVSSSFTAVIDNSQCEGETEKELVADELPPPNTQSMVPNLGITNTEVDMILRGISGRITHPPGLPAPSIRQTPIDEAAGNERIFAMAFPTLYPTGAADFNAPRLRKVDLRDYAHHMIRYQDGRFGRHPRWRFLVFNILMRQRAAGSARFYVSKNSGLKELSREELAEALEEDESLLPHIVRQGSNLTGTRPFWRSKGNSLQAMARFISPTASPVFVTFSAADMQWQDLLRHFPGYAEVVSGPERILRS